MNGFSDSGAKALSNALLVNKSLLHLDISNNRIGLEGAQNLSRIFEKTTPLAELMVRIIKLIQIYLKIVIASFIDFNGMIFL